MANANRTAPQQAAPQKVAFITSGAALCRALRENYTGDGKLGLIRKALATNPNMTAEEAYAILEADTNVTQRTLDKARGLIDSGKVPDTEGVGGKVNLEDVILADKRHLDAIGYTRPFAPPPPPPPAVPVKSEADIRAEVEAEFRKKMEQAEADMRATLAVQAEAARKADAERAAALLAEQNAATIKAGENRADAKQQHGGKANK